MKGFIYRTGIRLKELGERTGNRTLIMHGINLKDWASGYRSWYKS